jgi:hypothetical protein
MSVNPFNLECDDHHNGICWRFETNDPRRHELQFSMEKIAANRVLCAGLWRCDKLTNNGTGGSIYLSRDGSIYHSAIGAGSFRLAHFHSDAGLRPAKASAIVKGIQHHTSLGARTAV